MIQVNMIFFFQLLFLSQILTGIQEATAPPGTIFSGIIGSGNFHR